MSDSAARLEGVLQLTKELLEIPSETRDEEAIGDFVEGWARALEPDTLIRADNSLCIAMRPHDPQKRTLMLLGHTDTVPGLDDNPVRREGDLLYGLGASDMKAADAVILDLLRQNRERECAHNLVGVLYATEESSYESNELPRIRAAAPAWFERVDLAICMEPTDNAIELGCLGTAHAEVTFSGKRAHSARPWQGENAIHKAAALLGVLQKREPVEHTFHGLKFVESVSATTVGFRGARNVIPDRCTVNVNYRFAPAQTEQDVRAELDAMIGGAGVFELVDFCPSGRVCRENPLLEQLIGVLGDPEVRAKQAWTDVGRLSLWGVDAINWGPGALSQAHQAGEWVSIAEIGKSVAALDRWLF